MSINYKHDYEFEDVFHHRNAITKPAAPYFANIAPYPPCTVTDPSAETESLGLPADVQLAAFIALRL
jgi:hypothetical protein